MWSADKEVIFSAALVANLKKQEVMFNVTFVVIQKINNLNLAPSNIKILFFNSIEQH